MTDAGGAPTRRRDELDPRYHAAFQRGGTGTGATSTPSPPRSARASAVNSPDPGVSGVVEGVIENDDDAPPQPVYRLRRVLVFATVLIVSGLGASWWSATNTYNTYAVDAPILQTTIPSIVSGLAGPLLTVGLGLWAAVGIVATFRRRP